MKETKIQFLFKLNFHQKGYRWQQRCLMQLLGGVQKCHKRIIVLIINQCDQIVRFFALWGKFLKPLATINLHKSLTFLAIFVKVSKSIIFVVKLFWGNFYRHLAIFSIENEFTRTRARNFSCPLFSNGPAGSS